MPVPIGTPAPVVPAGKRLSMGRGQMGKFGEDWCGRVHPGGLTAAWGNGLASCWHMGEQAGGKRMGGWAGKREDAE